MSGREQRFIYVTIVETLQVGTSMHYARRVQFGVGLHLLQVIRADNRQVTTDHSLTYGAFLVDGFPSSKRLRNFRSLF